MADPNPDTPRTFPGDPNPPAKAPDVKAQQPPAQDAGGGASAIEKQTGPVQQSAPAQKVYRVSNDEGGGQSVYVMDDKLETSKLGAVSIPGSDDVLHAVGQFNPTSQTWTIPEDAAMKLIGGRLPLPAYLEAKWAGGEAATLRGMIGHEAFIGAMPLEDARARGNAELLKVQLNEAPIFAWQGGFGPTVAKMWDDFKKAGPSGAARRVAGEVAGTAPDLISMGVEALQGAVALGLAGAAGGAAATGGPGALPGLLAGGETGLAVGVFGHVFKVSTGNTYLDMLDKGFEPETAKKMAPLAGAINGLLMVGQVKFMTASLQRTFVKNVLASPTVKGALARYATEVSGGTTLAASQKAVDIIVNDISAQMDARPDLTTQHPISDMVNAVVTAGPVMAVLGLPGLGKEVLGARANTAAEVKSAAEVKTRLAERDTALKAEAAKPVEEVKPAAGADVKPGEAPKVVDPKGDYFADPAGMEKAVHESLDKLEAGKPGAAEEVNSTVTRALDELNNGPKDAKGEPLTYGQKINEAETKAASRQLVSDLADTQTLIKEMTQSRDRFERNGQSTRLLDRKLTDLMDKEQEIKNGITFYEAAKGRDAGVTANEKLLMKPATLESIANLGFVEGRKEVLDVRRQKILDVADKHELTQADMRSLLKDKNYGTMSDAEFDHWLNRGSTKTVDGVAQHVPSFIERAVALKERKGALENLRTVKKERAIVHEQYVRQLNELPPVAKMTTEQIKGYADILAQYEKGDVALTPARVHALETTELRGAKTAGEVRAKVAKLMDKPEAAFRDVKIQERDLFTPDPQLARKDPLRGYTVSRVKEFQARAELASHEVLTQLHELSAKAQSERRALMTVGARVADWLVPQQKELLRYMEIDKGTAYAGQVTLPDLTPSERAYADAWNQFSTKALGYLKETEELTSSRFSNGNYVPHVHRGLLEMVKDIASADSFAKEFKKSVKELHERLETPAGMPSDEIAKALGMRKAFDYTEFRTGDVKPSNNVFNVVDHYVKMFYNKVALDEAVPFVNTMVKAFAVLEKTPEGEALFKSISAFTDQYLAAKKGDARWVWAKGGRTESAIRFGMSLVAMKHIAVNLALQAMSPIGEGSGEFMVLGNGGIARAKTRRFVTGWEQTNKIFEKYKDTFVPEGPVEALHPGADVSDAAKAVMFGAFKAIRKDVMKDILVGSMTEAEFKAGEISPERVAAIKLEAGRWIDVHGNKSIRGASVMGSQWTQFKGWVIPPTLSIAEDVAALGKRIGGDKNAIKPEHVRDFYHLAQLAVAAAMFRTWATAEMEDDSFMGRAIHYARGEVMSMFSGPKALAGMLAGGVLMTETAKLANNLMMLATLEEYKTGEKEGELKGFDALLKQFTPAAAKQFQTKEK